MKEQVSVDLKRCPHCDAPAKLYGEDAPEWWVRCSQSCITPITTKEQAIENWNNRICDISVDNTLSQALKEVASNRAKIIEDYMKFYLRVNAHDITPESFAKDFHLVIHNYDEPGKMVMDYQMLPHDKMIIDKSELERLKRLDENIKRVMQLAKKHYECYKKIIGEKDCVTVDFKEIVDLLESLDK